MFYLFCFLHCVVFFFFKQKTAYELRISDWSSDVCSSDLNRRSSTTLPRLSAAHHSFAVGERYPSIVRMAGVFADVPCWGAPEVFRKMDSRHEAGSPPPCPRRSEEHTSELQSLMRISYAVFCLKKKTQHNTHNMYSANVTRITPRIIQ